MNASPKRLGELEEARGHLMRVIKAEGYCVAIYDFGAVALPLELFDMLQSLVCRNVAIFRIDGGYRVREVA